MKIAILSIQHTGTWFTIEALKRLTGFPCQLSSDYEAGYPLVHCHVYANGETEGRIKDMDHPDIWHAITHFSDRGYKIVIPLRDPLASIITRHNRHSNLSHRYLPESFEELSRVNPSLYFPFPIDLHRNDEDRQRLAQNMCSYLGIQYKPISWRKVQSAADVSGLRTDYERMDITRIIESLGQYHKLLKDSKGWQAMYKQLGYKFWWI